MLISAIRKFFDRLSQRTDSDLDSLQNSSNEIFILRYTNLLQFLGQFMTFLLIFYCIFSFYIKQYFNAAVDIVAGIILLFILLQLKKSRNYPLLSKLILSYILILSSYFFQLGPNGNGAFLWALITPLFMIFFLRAKEGAIASILFLIFNILLSMLNIFDSGFSIKFFIRFSGVFVTIVLISFIYSRIQKKMTDGLEHINITLKKTITNLHKTKKILQKSEERYRVLVENSNDGIGILRDFHFIYVNTKLSDISGYEKDELLKKPLDHLLKTDNRKLLQGIFNNETWSGLPRNRVELSLKTKIGEVVEVEIGTNTIEYENEQSQLIFIRDVRDRNLVEKERRKISNLESFRMVANGVTHDFNNILTIIMGNLELIKLNRQGNPKLDKPLKKIEEATGRATELLDDLYIFSTSAVKEESLENIKVLMELVLEPLKLEFTIDKFEQEFEDNLWKLRCDRKQICIALKNILLNSLDATEEKGQIKISITNFINQSRVVQPLQEKEYLQISIVDSGKGIPEDNLGRIFDPYFSTKGNVTEKGIGLGLAIANKIVLDHNGLINVHSKPGSGTTFKIFLPAEIV